MYVLRIIVYTFGCISMWEGSIFFAIFLFSKTFVSAVGTVTSPHLPLFMPVTVEEPLISST